MENDSAFVAPEGVYSVIEEHRPSATNPHVNNTNVPPASYPTKLSTVLIKYPAHNKASGSQAFAQLLGGGKEKDAKKDRGKTDDAGKDKDNHLKPPAREREDGASLSSSDTQDDAGNASPDLSTGGPPVPEVANTPTHEHPNTIFSTHSPTNTAGGKKKTSTRPKHSIRTTSSTFVSRVQTAEGLAKHLQSRQGEVTYVFYNHHKSFIWIEAGSKVKVCLHFDSLYIFGITKKLPLVPADRRSLLLGCFSLLTQRATMSTLPRPLRTEWTLLLDSTLAISSGLVGRSTHDEFLCGPNVSSRRTDPISNRYCRLNKQVCRPAQTVLPFDLIGR